MFEKRGTTTDRPSTRGAGRGRPTDSRPISPPSHTDPEARWNQSNTSVSPRGEVCAACPAAPGTISTAAAASSAPAVAPNSATDRLSRSGRSSHSATQRRDAEQREAQLQIEHRPPERGHPNSGTSAVDIEHRAQRVVGGGDSPGTRGSRSAPATDATTNATDTFRRLVPRTRRTSGRAISIRITNSPIAAITNTNITHRAMSSFALVAVAEMLGTLNCGAGPGFGPTA